MVVVFAVYPFIRLHNQRQKAIRTALFLAGKAVRTARRENKKSEDIIMDETDSSTPRRRNGRK